jgi:hypothetical protein
VASWERVGDAIRPIVLAIEFTDWHLVPLEILLIAANSRLPQRDGFVLPVWLFFPRGFGHGTRITCTRKFTRSLSGTADEGFAGISDADFGSDPHRPDCLGVAVPPYNAQRPDNAPDMVQDLIDEIPRPSPFGNTTSVNNPAKVGTERGSDPRCPYGAQLFQCSALVPRRLGRLRLRFVPHQNGPSPEETKGLFW